MIFVDLFLRSLFQVAAHAREPLALCPSLSHGFLFVTLLYLFLQRIYLCLSPGVTIKFKRQPNTIVAFEVGADHASINYIRLSIRTFKLSFNQSLELRTSHTRENSVIILNSRINNSSLNAFDVVTTSSSRFAKTFHGRLTIAIVTTV